jgi:hypothetical protein
LGLLLVAAAGARAQRETAVAIQVDACVPVDRAQLERLLAIELGAPTVQGESPVAATQIWVGCGPLGIELRLQDKVTQKSMTRTLPASSFRDQSSTRLLALAVAEFVVASWIELEVRPEPAVRPVGPRASPEALREAAKVTQQHLPVREGPPQNTVTGALTLQPWVEHDAVLLGAEARLFRLALPEIAWTIAASFGTGSTDVALGKVTLSTATLALGLGLHVRAQAVSFYTGPGGRLGMAYMRGEPRDPMSARGASFFAPFGGPLWFARFEWHASEEVRVALDLEGGIVTIDARAKAGDDSVLSLEGAWGTAGLAVGMAL